MRRQRHGFGKLRSTRHQGRGGNDAIAVRLQNAPVHARSQPEVIRINNEPPHAESLAGKQGFGFRQTGDSDHLIRIHRREIWMRLKIFLARDAEV
jgi:hypothetical protein